MDQKKRLKILNDFKDGQLPILVATDVASRGLHIEGVSHVVNWDLPQDAEDYVHRIGRTARAGAAGKAISLVDEAGALALEPIEKFIAQKIQVDWAEDDLYLPEIKPTSEERRRYAEEKRQRMAARGGGAGRPRAPGRRRRRWPAPVPAAAPAARNSSLPPEGRGQGEGRQGMTSPHVDLTLPDAERRPRRLPRRPWRDLLYIPGPDLTSPLDPGAYRSSLVVVRGDGVAIRVTSRVTPAFGGGAVPPEPGGAARPDARARRSARSSSRRAPAPSMRSPPTAGRRRARARAREWRYGGRRSPHGSGGSAGCACAGARARRPGPGPPTADSC